MLGNIRIESIPVITMSTVCTHLKNVVEKGYNFITGSFLTETAVCFVCITTEYWKKFSVSVNFFSEIRNFLFPL